MHWDGRLKSICNSSQEEVNAGGGGVEDVRSDVRLGSVDCDGVNTAVTAR